MYARLVIEKQYVSHFQMTWLELNQKEKRTDESKHLSSLGAELNQEPARTPLKEIAERLTSDYFTMTKWFNSFPLPIRTTKAKKSQQLNGPSNLKATKTAFNEEFISSISLYIYSDECIISYQNNRFKHRQQNLTISSALLTEKILYYINSDQFIWSSNVRCTTSMGAGRVVNVLLALLTQFMVGSDTRFFNINHSSWDEYG
ncbi:hypothetical protein DICVIV_13480 [Dictyocaulus viviparus]|uniref:Uncharacterized protein n=1 Tax=Dictyocaulus viviparus TaxID=29172 RepID=A0A0D8X7P6_DICVI|nr:hypothetical protein DICVIV_13480 [Dictyocaulus viviparus]